MYKIGLFLSLFILAISSTTLAQQNDSIPTAIKPSLLIKLGGLFYINPNMEEFNMAYAGLYSEIGVNKKNSINIGTEAHTGFATYNVNTSINLSFRHYFGYGSFQNPDTYSGTYVSPSLYFSQTPSSASTQPYTDFGSNERELNFIPNMGFGARLGQQYYGLVDFGVFGGLENATEKTSADNLNFAVKNSTYPIVKSYARVLFPIGNLSFRKSLAGDLKSYESKSRFFKFGIEDVFEFSKKGLFFHPKIAYETALGKSGFSANLQTNGYVSRGYYFDFNLNHSTKEVTISDKAYIHQNLSFVITPQLRYYLGHKKNANYSAKGFNLEGLYLDVLGQYQSGSKETKKDFWEFNKFSKLTYGAGLGFQKRIMQKIIVDANFSWQLGDNEITNTGLPVFGFEVFWLK